MSVGGETVFFGGKRRCRFANGHEGLRERVVLTGSFVKRFGVNQTILRLSLVGHAGDAWRRRGLSYERWPWLLH